jgi:hypothetical protein
MARLSSEVTLFLRIQNIPFNKSVGEILCLFLGFSRYQFLIYIKKSV